MGDPACWLHALCEECGGVIGEDHEGPCPRCGVAPRENDPVEPGTTAEAEDQQEKTKRSP